jgi:hypothetical protein
MHVCIITYVLDVLLEFIFDTRSKCGNAKKEQKGKEIIQNIKYVHCIYIYESIKNIKNFNITFYKVKIIHMPMQNVMGMCEIQTI